MAKIDRSCLLAVIDAETAVLNDSLLEPRIANKLLQVIGMLQQVARARAGHIGLVNGLLSELLGGDDVDCLPDHVITTMTELLVVGSPLAIYDPGLGA